MQTKEFQEELEAVRKNVYLHEAWKEIEEMESSTDYGVPRGALPF